jgi:DNA-directed RNA polymerase subunit RPC12/RpoP
MDPKIINILILLFTLYMIFSAFNYLLSLLFSKIGLSVIFLIWLLYQFYKRKRSGSGSAGGGTYYDRINTYSQDGGGNFEYSRNPGPQSPGLFARIKEWYQERKRKYHYAKFKKNWEAVQKKYGNDMRCPYCGSELTLFNVTENAQCNYCKNRLI